MKAIQYLFFGTVLLFITSCSGSDYYQGNWYATDLNGTKSKITFEPNKFTLKDSTGEKSSYEYSQNSVNIENGVRTYGIRLGVGRSYYINFPFSGDASKGAIIDANNTVLYTIGRDEYITYDEMYMLK